MEREYKLTLRQDEAYEYLSNENDVSVLYGGAKGGGKSWLLCLWVYYWAKHLIDLFGITEVQKFPIPIGFIGRKRSVDFSKTTFETWKKIILYQSYEIKEQDKEIIIDGKVKILFGGLDDQALINKFNSAELAFYAIDQAEETERGDVAVLSGSLRLKHNDVVPPYKRLYTANPAECWLKEDFISRHLLNHYYIPALYSDNPYLPANYEHTLQEAFSYDEVLLKAYKDGDWDALQADNVLITSKMLNSLRNIPTESSFKKNAVISCDPALGGDECIIDYNLNGEIVDRCILHTDNTMLIAAEVMVLGHKYRCFDFVCDIIGVGAGVADRAEQQGMRVIRINSAASAMNKVKFANVRAEMWWMVKELVDSQKLPFPKDEELRRQLVAVRYKIQSGKIQLELKEITKKRLGRSPDRADAFVYAIYALDKLARNITNKNPEFVSQFSVQEFVNTDIPYDMFKSASIEKSADF